MIGAQTRNVELSTVAGVKILGLGECQVCRHWTSLRMQITSSIHEVGELCKNGQGLTMAGAESESSRGTQSPEG